MRMAMPKAAARKAMRMAALRAAARKAMRMVMPKAAARKAMRMAALRAAARTAQPRTSDRNDSPRRAAEGAKASESMGEGVPKERPLRVHKGGQA
eukprot:2244443-Prymnesium_polylepis.1